MEGASAASRRLDASILRVAEFDCTTLVTGETGCGKEEVARAIHAAGKRAQKPFVTINCGGLPASIAESQFFGHEKGAFTGAVGAARGAFRAANGGVVFLDEIGEMPLELQPKLLQVLERREVIPVGGTHPEPIDVQVIAATNRDLEARVREGFFREDLLYRINTVQLEVPPLRRRTEDIPKFIGHFAAHYAALYDRPVWEPDDERLLQLMEYDWPGNVRQLAQTIQRLYVFGDSVDAVIDELLGGRSSRNPRSEEFPSDSQEETFTAIPAEPISSPQPSTFNLKEVRKQTVRAAIEATNGHLTKAAKLLGVCPNTMTKLVKEACPELRRARERKPRMPR